MYCPKCGTENPDEVRYCGNCGTAFGAAPAAAVPMMPKTSGLAVAALVCAILSIFTCMITTIPAIILGIVALVKINNSAGRLKGTGMAITGIVGPVVALPVAALLMGILMPALARVRQLALRKVCNTNLSGLSKAMMLYTYDYDRYPTPQKWCDLLIEYCEVAPQSFVCKGAPEGPCNYALNKNIAKLGTSTQGDIVLLFETYPGWNQVGGPEIINTGNHQGWGCNVAFVDMHVEFVRTTDIEYLKWKPD